MNDQSPGLREALQYPLFSAMFNRRSRRISKGISSVPAGSLSYTSINNLLILSIGVVGWEALTLAYWKLSDI